MPSRSRTEPALRCADHRTVLRSTITTDGDGGLVEYVEACGQCRSRVSFRSTAAPQPPKRRLPNMPKGRQNAAGQYVCIVCDAVLEYGGIGRPPAYCDAHRKYRRQRTRRRG